MLSHQLLQTQVSAIFKPPEYKGTTFKHASLRGLSKRFISLRGGSRPASLSWVVGNELLETCDLEEKGSMDLWKGQEAFEPGDSDLNL